MKPQLAKRFHENESGQISLLMMFGAVSLFLVIALVWNTGLRVSQNSKLKTPPMPP